LIHGIHAGSSWKVALRILHPNSGQIMGEGRSRVLSFCRLVRFSGLSKRIRHQDQRRSQGSEGTRKLRFRNFSPQTAFGA